MNAHRYLSQQISSEPDERENQSRARIAARNSLRQNRVVQNLPATITSQRTQQSAAQHATAHPRAAKQVDDNSQHSHGSSQKEKSYLAEAANKSDAPCLSKCFYGLRHSTATVSSETGCSGNAGHASNKAVRRNAEYQNETDGPEYTCPNQIEKDNELVNNPGSR